MQYYDIHFVTSAARQDQWPESSFPEIIFCGRSNAGKSSLINALTNRKNIAFRGKTPGKTKLLNFFRLGNELMLTDAPGYGYAKGGSATAESFGDLLEPYFAKRQQLCAMILVLDVRRIPNDDDLTMVEFARYVHLPVIVACVKCDKVGNSQQALSVRKISEVLNISQSSIIRCSSLKKTGIEELWIKIDDTIKKSKRSNEN